MFGPFSRVIAVAMAAVLAFGLLVPLALRRHDRVVALFVTIAFVAYLVVNVMVWQKMKSRA